MVIKIGDTVETIDDAIIGKVISVNNGIVIIEAEDGFEFQFESNELIKIDTDDNINLGSFSNHTLEEITREKESNKKRTTQAVKSKDRNKPMFVVDLHIHQLKDSTRGMTNFDMLNLQLDTARGQLDFAIRQRMPNMVFIHGIGEGVLKEELYTVLRRYNNVTFYDADYKLYGLGATEIKIFQTLEN
jgi:hypothetical protein